MTDLIKTTIDGTSLAIGTMNLFELYAAQASVRSASGDFLKFTKGEWTVGQDETIVTNGTRYLADMDNLKVGHQRWEGRKLTDQIMGLVADGYRPLPRTQLGELDKETWEVDVNGVRKDPWQLTSALPLKALDSMDLCVFVTASAGGRGAISDLCRQYGRFMRKYPGKTPIVEVGTTSYRHKVWGKVYSPTITIVGEIDKSNLTDDPEGTSPSPATLEIVEKVPIPANTCF